LAKQITTKMRDTTLMDNQTPHDTRLEERILGSLLIESEAYYEISSVINENVFYEPKHAKIFKAIRTLALMSRPIDILTVTDMLRKNGDLDFVGGAFCVTELTSNVSSSANIHVHAHLIKQKYLERETISLAQRAIKEIYSGTSDVFEVNDKLVGSIQKLTDFESGEISQLNQIIADQLKRYEQVPESGLTGMPSGLPSIDKITAGWQNSNLIIIAARPAMGKTALMLNLARNAAVIGKCAIAIFSLEMSKQQLTDRIISSETGIPLDMILKRTLQPHHFKLIHAMDRLFDTQIFIDDSASLSISSFRSKCAKLKRNHDIKFIAVDYLQLMKGEQETRFNREQEISSISRGLKAVAKDLNVPVLALSQLSRKVEERAGINGKRPMLSDLRESGSIEQDADQVLFLFRPEYYGMTEDEAGNSMEGLTELIFAKNRSGPIDTLGLRFSGAKMKFTEIEEITGNLTTEGSDQPAF